MNLCTVKFVKWLTDELLVIHKKTLNPCEHFLALIPSDTFNTKFICGGRGIATLLTLLPATVCVVHARCNCGQIDTVLIQCARRSILGSGIDTAFEFAMVCALCRGMPVG